MGSQRGTASVTSGQKATAAQAFGKRPPKKREKQGAARESGGQSTPAKQTQRAPLPSVSKQ